MPKQTNNKSYTRKENASKEISIIKTSSCPSLTRKSELTYQLGVHGDDIYFVRIVGNTGGGYFGKDWVATEDLLIQLEQCPECITSSTIAGLFHRKSANNAGFILAVLLHEGVIEPSEGKQRAYTLQDTKPFLSSMETLQRDAEQGNSKQTARRKQPAPTAKASS